MRVKSVILMCLLAAAFICGSTLTPGEAAKKRAPKAEQPKAAQTKAKQPAKAQTKPEKAQKKLRVAVVDLVNKTPNHIPIEHIMKLFYSRLKAADLYDLIPRDEVKKCIRDTDVGKEAAARRFDRFSAVRFARVLSADAILAGSIPHFERVSTASPLPFSVNGLDFTGRHTDVVFEARLILAENGLVAATVEGGGKADEDAVESMTGVLNDGLTPAFNNAVKRASDALAANLKSADLKPELPQTAEPAQSDADFYVVKSDKKAIYIGAGTSKGVSVGDYFIISAVKKNGGKEDLVPIAVARVTEAEQDAARLELTEPAKAKNSLIKVGDRAQRKTSAAAVELKKRPKSK